jgi:hypothetical protein
MSGAILELTRRYFNIPGESSAAATWRLLARRGEKDEIGKVAHQAQRTGSAPAAPQSKTVSSLPANTFSMRIECWRLATGENQNRPEARFEADWLKFPALQRVRPQMVSPARFHLHHSEHVDEASGKS